MAVYPIDALPKNNPKALYPDTEPNLELKGEGSEPEGKAGEPLYKKYLNQVKDFQNSESGKKFNQFWNTFQHTKELKGILSSLNPLNQPRKKFYKVKEKRIKAGIPANMPQSYFWNQQLQSHEGGMELLGRLHRVLGNLSKNLDQDKPSQLPETYNIEDYEPENEQNQDNALNQENKQPHHNHNLRAHLMKAGKGNKRRKAGAIPQKA